MLIQVARNPERESKARASASIVSAELSQLIHSLLARYEFNMNYIKIEVLCVSLSPREPYDHNKGIVREIIEDWLGIRTKPLFFVFPCHLLPLRISSDIYAFPAFPMDWPIDIGEIPLESWEEDLRAIAKKFFNAHLREKLEKYASEQKAIQVDRGLLPPEDPSDPRSNPVPLDGHWTS